jgi:hypothetical protein
MVDALRVQDCAEVGGAERSKSSFGENNFIVARFEFINNSSAWSTINNTISALDTGERLEGC